METTDKQLKTILCADVSEYSVLMEANEQQTHINLCARLSLIATLIDHYNGVTLRTEGDSILASFDVATDALQCAIKIHTASAEQNESLHSQEHLYFRIGINTGQAIIDRGEVFGTCVNIAARLQSIAKPGGIVISESVFFIVNNTLSYDYTCLGSQKLKNIVAPIKIYKIPLDTEQQKNKHTLSNFSAKTKNFIKPSSAIIASFATSFFITLFLNYNQIGITKGITQYTTSLTSSINNENNSQDLPSFRSKYFLNPKLVRQTNQNNAYLFDRALNLDLNNDDYELDTKKFIIVEKIPNSTEIIFTNVLWNY